MRKEKSEKNVGYNPAARFFLMLFFAVMAILILIPLYALLLGTFKGGAELFVSGLNLDPTPEKLHLRAWRYLFTGVMSNGEYQPHDYFIWYKNSFLLVLVQGTLTLLISSMVAYGFSKYQFRGKNVLFLCVLLVMMIPLGLNTLFTPYGNNYDLMITGSCFAILPLLLLYLLAQRFIIEGMTAGSVKG